MLKSIAFLLLATSCYLYSAQPPSLSLVALRNTLRTTYTSRQLLNLTLKTEYEFYDEQTRMMAWIVVASLNTLCMMARKNEPLKLDPTFGSIQEIRKNDYRGYIDVLDGVVLLKCLDASKGAIDFGIVSDVEGQCFVGGPGHGDPYLQYFMDLKGQFQSVRNVGGEFEVFEADDRPAFTYQQRIDNRFGGSRYPYRRICPACTIL